MQPNSEYLVLAPGPVTLHPKVQEALALPMIHHRTPEFDRILARVLQQMKLIFETKNPAFILSCTGSGAMEAALVNVLSPADHILCIDSGKFGERWGEMARAHGLHVDVLKVPWGEAVKVADVAAYLQAHPTTKAVLCQACETSTAVAHPIRELGDLIHQYPETLFLVDGITALGAIPLPMDEWNIDVVVGGSQKAFMLPTGLSFISFSQKAWARTEKARCPRFYFDLRKELKSNSSGETFFSSSVTLIRALDVSLGLMLEHGLAHHLQTIAERANFLRHFAADINMSLFAKSPSNSVTALCVPEGIDGQKLRSRLEEKYHVTVMGGQDQAKGKIIRVGHMGYITWDNMCSLILQLRSCLTDLAPAIKFSKPESQLRLEMNAWTKSRS